MTKTPLHLDETGRLEALKSYKILDTLPEQAFDDLTALAAYICGTPIALISLVDERRQWFKSKVGLPETETPRELAFCAHAIVPPHQPLIVPNALKDKRFATNSLVTSYPHIRFYAGAPLITSKGYALGTICAIDLVPRQLSTEQVEALQALSRQVIAQLELRRNYNLLQQSVDNAFHDALTGLANRALFMKLLGRSLMQTRIGKACSTVVVFLDLDRFKPINDSFGHLIGDRLLQAIAQRLKNCLRDEDTVARFGGDEFTILFENVKDISLVIEIVERIQTKLALPFVLNGHEISTTVSIGIAYSSDGCDLPEVLLRNADIAMYHAKHLGRARYSVFDRAMHTQATPLLQLETYLRRAIESQDFHLHYQPIFSLSTGRLSGFEALVRWQHPERGTISPAKFIPVAEETGLIVPIGRWVLLEACRQLRQWQIEFPSWKELLTISVNLSVKQFMQPDLLTQVTQILQQTGLEARSLKLEITESAIMEDSAAAVTFLQLKDQGIQLCMDDFGTGYSSLSYLHRFPMDILKIDRSFISNIRTKEQNLKMIETIVTLAHSLGMAVTAEGIETTEQLAFLKTLNCEFGQGHFFSKAVDSHEAGMLIAKECESVEDKLIGNG